MSAVGNVGVNVRKVAATLEELRGPFPRVDLPSKIAYSFLPLLREILETPIIGKALRSQTQAKKKNKNVVKEKKLVGRPYSLYPLRIPAPNKQIIYHRLYFEDFKVMLWREILTLLCPLSKKMTLLNQQDVRSVSFLSLNTHFLNAIPFFLSAPLKEKHPCKPFFSFSASPSYGLGQVLPRPDIRKNPAQEKGEVEKEEATKLSTQFWLMCLPHIDHVLALKQDDDPRERDRASIILCGLKSTRIFLLQHLQHYIFPLLSSPSLLVDYLIEHFRIPIEASHKLSVEKLKRACLAIRPLFLLLKTLNFDPTPFFTNTIFLLRQVKISRIGDLVLIVLDIVREVLQKKTISEALASALCFDLCKMARKRALPPIAELNLFILNEALQTYPTLESRLLPERGREVQYEDQEEEDLLDETENRSRGRKGEDTKASPDVHLWNDLLPLCHHPCIDSVRSAALRLATGTQKRFMGGSCVLDRLRKAISTEKDGNQKNLILQGYAIIRRSALNSRSKDVWSCPTFLSSKHFHFSTTSCVSIRKRTKEKLRRNKSNGFTIPEPIQPRVCYRIE